MESNNRLQSLDTLRGFDMFWITGGEQLVHVLAKVFGWGWVVSFARQMTHPDWNGLHAYDFIFPLFIFMAGVSTPFSFIARKKKGVTNGALLKKCISRGVILIILGIIYNNGLFHTPANLMRYPSVLGRIGLAGMFGQIIYLYFPSFKKITAIALFILVTYWLILLLVPVPGCGSGKMTIICNPVSYLDKTLLPGRLHKVIHDPEGILSTYPSIVSSLLGIIAGLILVRKDLTASSKLKYLLISGFVCLVVGLVWSIVLPINKNLWTSSFTLVVGGGSFLILCLFYYVIDVIHCNKWTIFFTVIGTNSIVIYLLKKFIDISFTADKVFGGILHFLPYAYEQVGIVIAYILVQWSLMYYLYKNKLFLKI